MKALLISLSILLTQCTPSNIPNSSRVKVISVTIQNGYWVTILRDTETGAEYLAFNHGLVKLEPSNVTKP